jgi:hypothetical protein
MSPTEEPRLTIAEYAELLRREQAKRGVTPADLARSIMAQLEGLRAEQEVKWLRDRIEGKNG